VSTDQAVQDQTAEEQAMGEDQAPEKQASWDWWLRRWLKSEGFWQGIVIQTVGTLAAALIIALIAIFVGVGYTAAIRHFVIAGLATLILIVGGTLVVLSVTGRLLRKLTTMPILQTNVGFHHMTLIAFCAAAASVLLLGLIFLIDYVLPAIARWTGYTA
jgi:hypothetical protein